MASRAIWILENLLKTTDKGLEWGSGRSTIWFSKRVEQITSIEHNPAWFETGKKSIEDSHRQNIHLMLFPIKTEELQEENYEKNKPSYVDEINSFQNNSLDFVIVDGIYRSACINRAVDKIRPGGILILDNANWFLPCHSISPGSRTVQDGPATPEWSEFLIKVRNWRYFGTSNGVTDTAIWIKA